MATAAEVQPARSEAAPFAATRSFTSSPEFELLVASCAHASHPQSDRIRKILSHPLNWERMLHLVDHHRVVPQVYGALSALSDLVPAQPLDQLRFRYQENARKALRLTAELVRIVRHLQSMGVRVLPFKGPILAQLLYGEVTRRQF